jgi:enoyl-CoA hydratase
MSMTDQSELIGVVYPVDGVAVVTINRPQARNALNVAAIARLGSALSDLDEQKEIRAIVLAGAGGHLSAGSDIKEMVEFGLPCLRDPIRMRGWAQIESVRTPILAAVDGMALGAGLELALTADFILAGPNARFGLPELRLGVMPGDGGSQRLPRRIGQAAAMRMILTGDILDVAEAVRLGLAEFAPDGALIAATAFAKRIAANAPIAARLAKEVARLGSDGPLATGLSLEAKALEVLFATKDRIEGMTAFVEKRTPLFRGI